MKKGILLFGLSLLVALWGFSQQEKLIFIGTYSGTGSHGIYVAKFNTVTGSIQLVDSIAADNPSYLALNADGSRLYAVNENGGDKPGGVSAFKVENAAGKLSFINSQASGGDHPCYISIDSKNKFAVVANYSGGSMSVLPLEKSGALSPMVQLIQHKGSSSNPDRQTSAHVHSAIFSPKENFVVVADLGTDFLSAYAYNAKNATPVDTTKKIVIKSSVGAGPRHIAFHPKLPIFYVMEELNGRISVHAFNKKNIALLQSVKADSISKTPGSADIHISADGRFVYASNRADANTIVVFQADPTDGKLTGVGTQSTLGKTPRNFTLDPTGKFLLAANQGTNNIVVFALDAATGMPMPTGNELNLPKPVCLVFQR